MRIACNLLAGVLVIMVMLLPQPLYACSVCMSAFEDLIVPPVYYWCFLSMGLFVLSGVMRKALKLSSILLPTIGKSIVYPIVLFVAGGMIFGIALPMILLIPVIMGAIMILANKIAAEIGHDKRNTMAKAYAILVLAVLITSIIYSIHIVRTRSRVDFIIEWCATAPARSFMMAMAKNGPIEFR
jgi:hypothetical protein